MSSEPTSQKEERSSTVRTGSSQDMIPIQDVRQVCLGYTKTGEPVNIGFIKTLDNRYVCILEIAPIEFDKCKYEEKERIHEKFTLLFRESRKQLQLKICNESSNVTELENNLLRKNKDATGQLATSINKYIEFAKEYGQYRSMVSRYFLIYAYEGDSKDMNDIAKDLYDYRNYVERQLELCGNYIIDNEPDKRREQLEYLYYFYNRKTSNDESLDTRIARMANDYNEYNKTGEREKHITVADMVAPKGLHFNNRSHVYADGKYYGYIGLTTKGFPLSVYVGWPNLFARSPNFDVDIHFKGISKQLVINMLKATDKFTEGGIYEAAAKGNADLARSTARTLQNRRYIKERLMAGDEIGDVSIIVTIRADSARELGDYTRDFCKDLRNMNISYEVAYLDVEDYYTMTSPLLFFRKPFDRLKHNILSSEMGSMYPFTRGTMYDPTGCIVGIVETVNTLAMINPFNTKLFSSAGIMVLGMIGSGKTYIMQLLMTRLFYNGIDIFAVIPKKASNDYPKGCKMVGGTYVSLIPGSNDCVNIMEIRPEKSIDTSKLDDGAKVNNVSLLSKKMASLNAFIRTLCKGVVITNRMANQINEHIRAVYAAYGINDDDDTIYEGNFNSGRLKKMPILQDMYEAFSNDPDLEDIKEALKPFIEGMYKNFNGQTNVDLNSRYIVFDCDEDMIPDDSIFPAIVYIAYDYCYDRVKSVNSKRSYIVLDEAWKLMTNEESAKQVENMAKIVRGYGAGFMVATQEVEDWIQKGGDHGMSVINNAAITVALKMKPTGARLLEKTLELTNSDIEYIKELTRGRGYLIYGSNKTKLEIASSQYEIDCLSDRTSKNSN